MDTLNKLEYHAEYRVYLLNFLMGDFEHVIDEKVLSYEEFIIQYNNKIK